MKHITRYVKKKYFNIMKVKHTFWVGWEVGLAVGAFVGAEVGLFVGNFVGAGVGSFVGAGVGCICTKKATINDMSQQYL